MELTREQFSLFEPLLPVQRGNVSHDNLKVVNALGADTEYWTQASNILLRAKDEALSASRKV